MNTLKITKDILPDTFENVIDASKSNETVTVIRSNLEKFEDIDKWVQIFGHNTRTHWNVRDSIPKGVQILCSKKFVCHHSRFMKVRYENNKKGVSKNADCLSQILVQIKLNTINTRAKDSFVKKGLCGVVTIKNIHSHTISSAQCLRFLPADQMVKNKFWDYFDNGMGIAESRKHHQQIIELMGGSEVEYDLASGKSNPTYRTVRYWHDQWSSQPSTSSSCGTPSADPFGGEEPSCSREEVPGVATTLQLLPEQTEEPFLGVVNKPRSYKKGSDKTYCRFCLQSSGKNTSTPLAVVDLNYPGKSDVFRKKKMEKVEEINKMLRFCLPFYDSLTFNPVICSICLGRLKVAYEFSKQCFKNQQLIEKYADTYSATERVINLNEMIETKFKLPDDGNMSESETFSDIPQVTRTSNRISQKRKYPNYNDPPLKKRKACSETYEDDSTNSSDNTSNIKIEPDDDDNSGLMESLKMELDDEDNSFGFTERTLDDVPQSYNISEEGIKVEPNYIDCPDFIKSEQVDDLHEEHKVFDERTGIGTDSERQHLYSQGLGNVSVATKNDPLFVKEPSFSTVGTGLEDSTDD